MQGPYNFSDPESFIQNAEGDLDAETDLGLTWPTPLIAYNTGGYDVIHDPWVIQVVADRDYHELRLYQKDGLESEPFVSKDYPDHTVPMTVTYLTSNAARLVDVHAHPKGHPTSNLHLLRRWRRQISKVIPAKSLQRLR